MVSGVIQYPMAILMDLGLKDPNAIGGDLLVVDRAFGDRKCQLRREFPIMASRSLVILQWSAHVHVGAFSWWIDF